MRAGALFTLPFLLVLYRPFLIWKGRGNSCSSSSSPTTLHTYRPRKHILTHPPNHWGTHPANLPHASNVSITTMPPPPHPFGSGTAHHLHLPLWLFQNPPRALAPPPGQSMLLNGVAWASCTFEAVVMQPGRLPFFRAAIVPKLNPIPAAGTFGE